MLNILGVVFTSKNKNVKSIAFLLGFCSSSKGVSSLNFSLLHFPTLSLYPTHWLMFFPFPEIVSFSILLLPDIPSSVASWFSPLPFCAKSARFLCRCQQGQHTHEALLDLHFINQKAAFCSLYSHPSFKNFSLVLLPSQPLLLPYILLPHQNLGNFFSCFCFLLLKLPFSYLFSTYFLWIILLPGCHLCC